MCVVAEQVCLRRTNGIRRMVIMCIVYTFGMCVAIGVCMHVVWCIITPHDGHFGWCRMVGCCATSHPTEIVVCAHTSPSKPIHALHNCKTCDSVIVIEGMANEELGVVSNVCGMGELVCM